MADTDIKLSVDLDVQSAEQTAQNLQKEIEGIFKNRKSEQSASLTQLELQMKKSYVQADALKRKLSEVGKNVPTAEFIKLEKEIESVDGEINRLSNIMDRTKKTMNLDVALKRLELLRSIQKDYADISGILSDEKRYWDKDEIVAYRNELESQIGVYDELVAKRAELGAQMDVLIAKEQEMIESGQNLIIGKETDIYKQVQQQLDLTNDKMKQQIVRHREVEYAEEQKAQKTEESNERVEKSNEKATHSYRRAGKTAVNEAHKIGSAFTKRLLPSVRSVRNAVSRMSHSLTKGLQPATKNVKRLAMRFLMLSLGARSLFALLRKVRTAIIKSFEDLQKSGVSPITKQIKELKATLNQVKSSFIAAFEPIIAMILPYLQRMAEALGNVIDKLAQFIAVLAGKNKYIRAIKQVGDAVEDSGDKAEGSLASFDKLNNITFGKKGTEYEEVEVDESVASAAITVKEKLDKILEDFRNFKKQIKGIIDKIKIGDWLGASADLGSLVDTLLTKLTEKIKNFIPDTGQAEKLGKAIAQFLRNAHLSEHLVEAAGVLGDAIVSIFTIAFSTLRSFSDDELYHFGENIMDAIIKIFDAIIDVLKNLPTREIAMVLRGALSKAWDIVDKLAEVLKLLFVKAFSVLWTTLTGDELTEGAEKAIGEAAVFTTLAIGIWRVVKAIRGGSGVTGLLTAFKEKDDAFNRQQKPLENEVSGMGRLWDGIRNVGRALGNNLIPLIIGTTGIISIFNSGTDTATTETSEFEGATEDLGKTAKEAQPSIKDLGKEIKNEGKKADKSADQTNDLKKKIRELSGLGSDSYTLSGIQAVSNMLAGIGTSASNSISEIDRLEEKIRSFNSNGGNTVVVSGTSGVTANTNTGKINSPTTSGGKATNTKKNVQITWADIKAYAEKEGMELTDYNINWISDLLKEHPEKSPLAKEKSSTSDIVKNSPVLSGDRSGEGTYIPQDVIDYLKKDRLVSTINTAGREEFHTVKGLSLEEIIDLVQYYGDAYKAKAAYDDIMSLSYGGGTSTRMATNSDIADEAYLQELISTAKQKFGIDLDPYTSISDKTMNTIDRLVAEGGIMARLMLMLWNAIDFLQGRGFFGGGMSNVIRPNFKGVKALATGAVIPAGRPFLAMLGDQKSGTNVEAPLDTIKQALAEVLAEVNMGATFQIIGDPHGMFKVVQKEANNYTKATGRLAF